MILIFIFNNSLKPTLNYMQQFMTICHTNIFSFALIIIIISNLFNFRFLTVIFISKNLNVFLFPRKSDPFEQSSLGINYYHVRDSVLKTESNDPHKDQKTG